MRSISDEYDYAEDRKEEQERDTHARLEGRVRALEAIIMELPEVTPDLVRAAKERLRGKFKNFNQHYRKRAEVLELADLPFDPPAETALDDLLREAESKEKG